MKTIVYLHGFASAGDSEKSQAIRKRFPDCKVLSPDLSTVCLPEVMKLLQENYGDEFVFVGTSLGGFWANVFAQLTNSHAVLVNPSITPSLSLPGTKAKNYKTGESIKVTDEDIAQLKGAEALVKDIYNGKLIDLFLAQDDYVIPFLPTISALAGYNSAVITSDGGHRYAMHWNKVLDKLAELI
jgi:hypothetical protein